MVIRRLADEEEIAAAEVEASKPENRVTYVDGITGEAVSPNWVDPSAGLVSPFQLDW